MATAIAEAVKACLSSAISARMTETRNTAYVASSAAENSTLVSGSNGSSSGSAERVSGWTESGRRSKTVEDLIGVWPEISVDPEIIAILVEPEDPVYAAWLLRVCGLSKLT